MLVIGAVMVIWLRARSAGGSCDATPLREPWLAGAMIADSMSFTAPTGGAAASP